MNLMRLFLSSFLLLGAMLAFPIVGNEVHAQSQANYRLLVMGEDSDPTVIRRSNDIYKRVIAEIRRPMRQNDFDVLDEDILAAELGFSYKNGMEKKEVIQAVMLANKSKNANNRTRFLSLIRIHVFPETMGFTKQVHIRLDGELYDMNTNLFIESYEIPESTFSAPIDCNDICLIEKAGGYAREMSSNLGATLTKQLKIYTARSTVSPASQTNSQNSVVPNSYTLTLKNFSVPEVSKVVAGLRSNSPETVSLDLLESDGMLRRYQFVTRSKNEPISDKIYQLMDDLGLGTRDFNVAITTQNIAVEKLKY